ncbi:MAG TPA: hypothetical protein VNG12_18310 [Acidimicrobiales bacterium]|nr:hypothetical protein [Acidimicrobiales bacterium]
MCQNLQGTQCESDSGRIKLFLAYTLAGVNKKIVFQWLRDHRLLDASHPDALPPLRKARSPRRNRASRWDDLAHPARAGPAG